MQYDYLLNKEVEEALRFSGNTVTLLHPVVVAFTLLVVVLVFSLRRRDLLVPLLVALVLIPTGQRLVLAGVNLTIFRLLLVCTWCRLLVKGEYRAVERNRIDRAFVWWVIAAAVTYTILWSNAGALMNRVGVVFDALAAYFLVRVVVDDQDGVERVIKTLVGVAVVVGILMMVEGRTERNPFAELGGVPEVPETREGRVRAQGPFNHPILAGTFGATLLPMVTVLWWRGRRGLAITGCIAALAITWAASSSGPMLTLFAGIFGLMMWPLRNYMAWVRRGIVVVVVGLHIVMRDPVWALPSRLDVFAGSTGYHRFNLIDNFIRRFDEWFLVGVRYTSGWGFYLIDHTNQYVSAGTSGGIVTLGLLLLVLTRSFSGLGRARNLVAKSRRSEQALWALSSMLFAHVVAFFGVSYFGQMTDLWYLTLGLISAVSSIVEKDGASRKAIVQEHVHA